MELISFFEKKLVTSRLPFYGMTESHLRKTLHHMVTIASCSATMHFGSAMRSFKAEIIIISEFVPTNH